MFLEKYSHNSILERRDTMKLSTRNQIKGKVMRLKRAVAAK